MKKLIQIRKNGKIIAYRSSIQRARNYVNSLFNNGNVLPNDKFSLYILTTEYKYLTQA